MLIFDGHLDLAGNALQYERDLRLSVAQQRKREMVGTPDDRGTATVGLPDMRQAGVAACLATLLARAKPWVKANRPQPRSNSDWPAREMAHGIARGQLAFYREMERQGEVRMLRTAGDLDAHWKQWEAAVTAAGMSDPSAISNSPSAIGLILTLEGADPIVTPDQLGAWHEQGLRTLMLAHFGQSGYAAGTPSTDHANQHDLDGPLTDDGRALLTGMDDLRMPLDLSHLSDTSFAQAIECFGGLIYSSHTACRALVPGNMHVHPMRMHTDDQIKQIIERGGVIGLPMFNAFLMHGYGKGSVTLDHVAQHADHICQLAGSTGHVAIGTDLDGGFGSEHTPAGLDAIADLPNLGDALRKHGYRDDELAEFFHGNWMTFWRKALPA